MYKLAYLHAIAQPTEAMTLIAKFCQVYPTLRNVSALSVLQLATRTTQEHAQYTSSLSPAQLLSYQEIMEQIRRLEGKTPGTLSFRILGRKKLMTVQLTPQTQDRHIIVSQKFLDIHGKKYPGYSIEICCHNRPSARAMADIISWTKEHQEIVHTVHWQKEHRPAVTIPARTLWATFTNV